MGSMPADVPEEVDVLLVGAGFGAFTLMNKSVSCFHVCEIHTDVTATDFANKG
jgi:hypothetical protein